ncbi:hypothetical protein BDP81DRAFT_19162 [Colletotrichum phormii]|uniref:Uncharacterized protein n=1 Tax=Colletotrichum phormii TaxID=359342 RepID=A0AAJ0A4E1_9PEZI|nr:uncharacterized protein BDP81DRAFT_19162 [Colletotrichum phormii]KAK1656277.1 hypothetical protein BDP81DRAFT_19162 [Colletotrichum phormii]
MFACQKRMVVASWSSYMSREQCQDLRRQSLQAVQTRGGGRTSMLLHLPSSALCDITKVYLSLQLPMIDSLRIHPNERKYASDRHANPYSRGPASSQRVGRKRALRGTAIRQFRGVGTLMTRKPHGLRKGSSLPSFIEARRPFGNFSEGISPSPPALLSTGMQADWRNEPFAAKPVPGPLHVVPISVFY